MKIKNMGSEIKLTKSVLRQMDCHMPEDKLDDLAKGTPLGYIQGAYKSHKHPSQVQGGHAREGHEIKVGLMQEGDYYFLIDLDTWCLREAFDRGLRKTHHPKEPYAILEEPDTRFDPQWQLYERVIDECLANQIYV